MGFFVSLLGAVLSGILGTHLHIPIPIQILATITWTTFIMFLEDNFKELKK